MITVEPSPLSDITIVGAEQLSVVIDLLIAQEARQWARDPRLRTARSPEQVVASLIRSCEQVLVARDARGRVRGYVRPSVWQLAETSMLRAFLSARNGVAQQLILPDPADEDAQAVLAGLLSALSIWWKDQGTTGDLVRWPSADSWIEPSLAAQDFRLDSVCAARGSHIPVRRCPLPGIVTRQAWPADEEALDRISLARIDAVFDDSAEKLYVSAFPCVMPHPA